MTDLRLGLQQKPDGGIEPAGPMVGDKGRGQPQIDLSRTEHQRDPGDQPPEIDAEEDQQGAQPCQMDRATRGTGIDVGTPIDARIAVVRTGK
ncbi:MAG: hypothetical protein RLZZ501_1913 [Pseudomonadota bacterium]|jgi:hypothetical protein